MIWDSDIMIECVRCGDIAKYKNIHYNEYYCSECLLEILVETGFIEEI